MDIDDDQSRWGHESKWMVNSLSRLYREPISFSIRIVILINKNLPMYSWLETIQSEVVYCIIIHLSSVLCLCFVFVQRKLKRMLDFVVLCVVYTFILFYVVYLIFCLIVVFLNKIESTLFQVDKFLTFFQTITRGRKWASTMTVGSKFNLLLYIKI